MISVRGVSKRFGENVAVDDVSFEAEAGSITYLLGPNGAGKTTVMRMIAGLTRAASGSVRINDKGLLDFRDTIGEIGFSLGAFSRNPKHTARQHLLWQARLGGVPAANVGRVLEQVGLEPVARRSVGKFSYGMLQRLGIASALLGDPRTLVLDEPANGLDVEGTLWLRELVVGLAAEGKCLLIASHNLTEVEITGDRIVVMGKGKVLSDTSKDELVAKGSGPRRLESAYIDLTRTSVEYTAGGGER
ncbi:ATP-binding cassette domain-containing protein [Nocardia cyriacigeorgica]|uniref:ATP-binding cassette domain-containing protein n=1 Tax=Nocardia cyriacigeorgica TaxID=135487 RepID=A0A6P1D1D5_9NOCA|nr:ATP-binding cassette domain-containing protein [Nocardia cyriacigeorgica]NEW39018.1 ATP-binding cassette domain-containing protein [Nocardia cyriacigeorgica]NEW43848.1 ATP-binding cassette domain-containing protein [Nocardia cyriacigeorgica]NEW50255.1 ATP-binding cassette domain-containing protein [Nocardia cyriacigeorgica]NEW58695.1 ATP-binding cassette domain-containing protein [Nocardia cyriacigeorgica]